MGKIRVRTLGDESQEKAQKQEAKNRKVAKDIKKGKAHTKGLGLKGGQQIAVVEGDQLKPEIEAMLHEGSELSGVEEKKSVKGGSASSGKKIVKKLRSRRYKQISAFVDKRKSYPLEIAIELLKKTANTKFDATVEAHINLNPEMLSAENKGLSGSVNLPHGTGKQKIVAIADENLIKKIEAGKIEFDILVAHPSIMPKLAKFARVLGPKGLMPNPKNGTVSENAEKRAKELAGGETQWKTEPKNPLIHFSIGKVSFKGDKLQANIKSLIKSIGTNKILKFTLSSTMGPGICVDVGSRVDP